EGKDASARRFLRNTLWNRAGLLTRLGRHAAAAADWQRAAELEDGPYRRGYQLYQAGALARAGERAAAAKLADELAKVKEVEPRALVELARVHALCARAARAEPAVAERHGGRSVELLARALAAGHFQAEAIRKDEDFAELKSREEFRK